MSGPSQPSWRETLEQLAARLRSGDHWRRRRVFEVGDAMRLRDLGSGTSWVSFASNDYLGLSRDPRVIDSAIEALGREGAGATSARLVVGTRSVHVELEEALAAHHGVERALVFPTGYMANMGALSALGLEGVTILSDELNHASIIDGARLARAGVAVYRHLDLTHLEQLLEETPPPVLVVSELVFSMDGDAVDRDALQQLCSRHGALLVLDEAHAVLESPVAPPLGDLLHVGTLSKTLGSLGGYVAGAAELVDLIENRARSYLFTTGSTPAAMAAALRALEIVESDEGTALRARLATNIEALAPGHSSPIVPIVVGAAGAALEASAALGEAGFYLPAIRPPTVPAGTSRLRATLSATHTAEQVLGLRIALERLGLSTAGRARLANASEVVPPTIAVVGTGTDVGKTFIASELIRALRAAGLQVAARKPLQSFLVGDGPTDAERLADASGEPADLVCSARYSYAEPVAPPFAARRLGRPEPRTAEVLAWLRSSLLPGAAAEQYDTAVVELVGGLASPHTVDGDGLALLRALAPWKVLLVAGAGLGTLSDVGLAVAALRRAIPGVGIEIVLNRYRDDDQVHRENLDWLTVHAHLRCFAGDESGRRRCYEELCEELSPSLSR